MKLKAKYVKGNFGKAHMSVIDLDTNKEIALYCYILQNPLKGAKDGYLLYAPAHLPPTFHKDLPALKLAAKKAAVESTIRQILV